MGDRANVYVTRSLQDPGVYLYTHWYGHDLPRIVQAALKKRLRWNDPSYLARIVFCEMLTKASDAETGFGIATQPPDNEHRLIVLDTWREQVHVTECPFTSARPATGSRVRSFEEFCELPEAELDAFCGRS